MTPLLSNAAYAPLPANIVYSEAAFQELLRIRYSSDLFGMATFDEVQNNLTFLNTGQNQVPGLDCHEAGREWRKLRGEQTYRRALQCDQCAGNFHQQPATRIEAASASGAAEFQ
jgi:hypothetical protein